MENPLSTSNDAVRHAIAMRRSFALGDLSDQPVERAHIDHILEAANWAPSHGKTEPWRFVVYTGNARQQLGEAFGTAFRIINPQHAPGSEGEKAQINRAFQAPVWIALGMRPSGKMPEWEDLVAMGCAVQNMHLMASALGLAGKWTSGATAMHSHVAEVVGFAPDTKLYGFFYIGHPAVAWPEGVRQPIDAKVRWVDEPSA
jgi:nitroreductase